MKKKVLLVAYNNLGLGGIQNVIMNIVRNLSDEFRFDVVCFDSVGTSFDREFLSYGGQIFRVENLINKLIVRKLDFYFGGRQQEIKLQKIIRANGPYIAIHSHREIRNGLMLRAAYKCGIPVRIAHTHTAFERRYHKVTKVYIDYLSGLTDQYATARIACSKMARECSFGDKKYHVICNTVDRRFLNERNEHSFHDNPFLLQVGMMCSNKNQLFSILVLKELKKKFPHAQLALLGSPKDAQMEQYFQTLKEQVRINGLKNSIAFLSADSDVKAAMERADYLIMPSLHEGLGIVPLEAQALGMKCFISKNIPQEVNCGGCVFIALDDGPETWAEHIAEQFELDRGARENYDMSRFLPEVIMEQYRKLYKGETV